LPNAWKHASITSNPVDGPPAQPSYLNKWKQPEETDLVQGAPEKYLRNAPSSAKAQPWEKEEAVISKNIDINKTKSIKHTFYSQPSPVRRFRRLSAQIEHKDLRKKIAPYIKQKSLNSPVSRFRRLSEKMELRDLHRKLPPYIKKKSDQWRTSVLPISGIESKIKLEKDVGANSIPDKSRSMTNTQNCGDHVDRRILHKSISQNKAPVPDLSRKVIIDSEKQKDFVNRNRESFPFGVSAEDMTKRRLSRTNLVYKHLNENYGSSATDEQDIKLVKATARAKVLMRKINFQIRKKYCKEFRLYSDMFYQEMRDLNCGIPKKQTDTSDIFAVGKGKVPQVINQTNLIEKPWNRIRNRRFSISYIDIPKRLERCRSKSLYNLPTSSRCTSASVSTNLSRKSTMQSRIGSG
jgi:hypothetical protein